MTKWGRVSVFECEFCQRGSGYLSEGLLRLFFKPMLLLEVARRPDWFFTASSHMPIPPDEPPLTPLLSRPPGPAHIPTPSTHWLPMEELPIDKPECCERTEKPTVSKCSTRTKVPASAALNWSVNSRGLSAGLFAAAAALRASRPPAAFPAGPAPRASPPWRAQRRRPRSSPSHPPRDPAAEGPAAATS